MKDYGEMIMYWFNNGISGNFNWDWYIISILLKLPA